MAKPVTIKLYERSYNDSFNGNDFLIQSGNEKKAVCIALDSGDQLIFEGKNLDYKGGVIVSGIIDTITMANEKGQALQSFTNLDQNAGFIPAQTMGDFLGFVSYMLANKKNVNFVGTNVADELTFSLPAKSEIFGRGGDDILAGGGGKDILNGGQGSDTFVFGTGFGKDTIVDFDAKGNDQDLIDAVYPGKADIHNSGKHDVVIDFGNGDELLLLDVRKNEIDASDFAV